MMSDFFLPVICESIVNRKIIKRVLTKFKKGFSNKEVSPYMDFINSTNMGPGNIGIDLGANVGNITEIMASKGATIYAFEPNPFAYKVLSDRFSENSNVICINKGVLDRNDKLRLYLHENCEEDQIKWSTGSSFLEFKGNVIKEKFIEVEVIDLVQFIEEIESNIKLIKMDVEGVECQILNKLISSSVFNKIENIIVETHDHKVCELKDETNMLRKKIRENGLTTIRLDWI